MKNFVIHTSHLIMLGQRIQENYNELGMWLGWKREEMAMLNFGRETS
jgi:hypothetical protein